MDVRAGEVEVRGLTYGYPDGRPALAGVDLTVPRGERLAVLGPNGAGKTTLALHLNGILKPAAGTVRVDGLVVSRHLKEVRRRVGIVFQDPDDQLFMTSVGEDVAFGPANLGYRGAELHGRVDRALAAVGMGEASGRPPHHLSFGERRRVALATVLAMDPTVLVLDEPTSNLDPAGRRELADVLTRLPVTLVMITHDLPYALQLCERSVVMDGGRIVADAPTASLLRERELLERHRLELPYGFELSSPA
ncbi:MAG: energy-coupling factor ABC transporter ATP-binding protein [Actinomycetota bacterium]|nr:energy-coupling factor ABC transporter ATP-binding protein [Actinomycetota bacterium]